MNRRPMILFSAAVVAAMTLLSAWAWTQLPAGAEVPIHWGIDGQVDGYASKEVGLFLLPVDDRRRSRRCWRSSRASNRVGPTSSDRARPMARSGSRSSPCSAASTS